MDKQLPGAEDQPDETPEHDDHQVDGTAVDYTEGPHTADEDLPAAEGGVETHEN
jgi:hypothetical protein